MTDDLTPLPAGASNNTAPPAKKPEQIKLTPKQHELLNYFLQEYLLHQNIPSKEKCVAVGICSAQFYADALKSEAFRHAMGARGIVLRGDITAGYVLTPEQIAVANAMLDLRDNRSQKKKLQELNVPTQKYEAWLRDPAFQHYLRERSENLLGDSLHEAHLALVDRVRAGDTAAIKYYYEITGRYVPNSNDKVDVANILMRMLEIIQRHVTDSDTLAAIAEETLMLANATSSGLPRVMPGQVVRQELAV